MKRYAITRISKCGVCGRPVELVETARAVALFEPGKGTSPHVCPDEAVSRLKRVWSMARTLLAESVGKGDLPG